MADEPQDFLSVTQAAQRVYEALRELKGETDGYSEAASRLESAAVRAQALADSTIQVLEEQGRRWDELKQLLDDQVRPALDRISDNAEKQTVHLSSLSGAVAGQQSQLTLVQQGVAENSRVLSEIRPSLGKLEKASGEQRTMLQQQSDSLKQLHEASRELTRVAWRGSRAAIAAAVFSSIGLVALVVALFVA